VVEHELDALLDEATMACRERATEVAVSPTKMVGRYPLPGTFDVALAEYAVGLIGSDELPHVALCALRERVESPMLAALAGGASGGVPADLREMFTRGLADAGVALPDEHHAALRVIEQAAHDLLAERVPSNLAILRLHEVFVILTGFGSEVAPADQLSTDLMQLRACVWRWYSCDHEDDVRGATISIRSVCERLRRPPRR
jgi:hypothetical protein